MHFSTSPVGTWWFAPEEANSCCSSAIRDSFVRATTYSFGSICFGSLIVAIIEATREMVRQSRESGDGILVCLADCCLGCLESLVEYFNNWAYVSNYTMVSLQRSLLQMQNIVYLQCSISNPRYLLHYMGLVLLRPARMSFTFSNREGGLPS